MTHNKTPRASSTIFPFSSRAGPGAAAPGGGGGFSGVGDPTGFANSAPPPPGTGAGAGAGANGGHFPLSTYATFEAGALAKVEGKIRELDAGLADGVKVRAGNGIECKTSVAYRGTSGVLLVARVGVST